MKTPLKNKPPKWFIDYMEVFQQTINDKFAEVNTRINEVDDKFEKKFAKLEKADYPLF